LRKKILYLHTLSNKKVELLILYKYIDNNKKIQYYLFTKKNIINKLMGKIQIMNLNFILFYFILFF